MTITSETPKLCRECGLPTDRLPSGLFARFCQGCLATPPTLTTNGDLLPPLWHFTSATNLASVRKHGLLPLGTLKRKKLAFRPASSESSREWDAEIQHDRFVHLCGAQEHPMAWVAFYQREVDVRWIRVDPAIVDQRLTLYTSSNAIRRGIEPSSDPQVFLDGDDQAEVLVRGAIPIEFLEFPKR